jgi:hypothetical protein
VQESETAPRCCVRHEILVDRDRGRRGASGEVIGAGSVNVASVLASARPVQLPRVMVIAAPERTVPWKRNP